MQYYGNYIAGFNIVHSSGWKVLHYNLAMPMLY